MKKTKDPITRILYGVLFLLFLLHAPPHLFVAGFLARPSPAVMSWLWKVTNNNNVQSTTATATSRLSPQEQQRVTPVLPRWRDLPLLQGTAKSTTTVGKDDGIDLTSNGGVIVYSSTGGGSRELSSLVLEKEKKLPPKGTPLAIAYRGTLVASNWSPLEVVDCWLAEQQGLHDLLADAFLQRGIDEATLTNPEIFTETFVTETLASAANAAKASSLSSSSLPLSKIQVKKLVMAAKRLAASRNSKDYTVGTEFDAQERYEIAWKENPKLIAGMQMALEYMLTTAAAAKDDDEDSLSKEIAVQCRCDYAYGSEGYRKRTGEILVPPFTTLRFSIRLLDDPPLASL